MSWPTYEREPTRDPRLPPSRGIEVGGARIGSLSGQASLGPHFDDATWPALVRQRGWELAVVAGEPGYCSPVVGDGVRILFAGPDGTSPHGLDDATLVVGFRVPTSDRDRLWRVRGHGDGELIFDKLLHAGRAFDVDAFLDWLDDESMADATEL